MNRVERNLEFVKEILNLTEGDHLTEPVFSISISAIFIKTNTNRMLDKECERCKGGTSRISQYVGTGSSVTPFHKP